MDSQRTTPLLANIRLHPIKALDPVSVSEARIGPNGGLELDRVWALYSADGRWVNGKRTAAMHLIRAAYSPDISSVTLTVPGDRRDIPAMNFAFPGDTEGAADWFSMYFEQAIQVRYTREGFPDDGLASGPTIVSTGSLESVCVWFPGVTLDEVRRRFRTTLEIDADRSAGHNGSLAGAGNCRRSGRINYSAKTIRLSCASKLAISPSRVATPARAAQFPLATRTPASQTTAFKSVSANSAAHSSPRGLPPRASTTSIASPRTPASPAPSKANYSASATRSSYSD